MNSKQSLQTAIIGIVRRETIRLVALVAIALVTALVTRAVAQHMRDVERRDAAEWFDRGQQSLRGGDHQSAALAFRRAEAKQRGEKRYVLALAEVLFAAGNLDAAERALLRIRASQPDDPQINVALARVAAGRRDVPAAIRYYHNALYAPHDDQEAARGLRLELIRFLIQHDEQSRAVSELIAAAVDLPPASARHITLAQLFADAGDERRALEHYERVLRVTPDNSAALVGAGRAAFAIGDYARVRRHLEGAPKEGDVETLLRTADLVLGRDPLASRIGTAERRRRVLANIADARRRIATCLTPRSPESSDAMLARIDALGATQRMPADSDAIEAAMRVVIAVEREALRTCEPSPIGQAMLLIAQRHGIDEP